MKKILVPAMAIVFMFASANLMAQDKKTAAKAAPAKTECTKEKAECSKADKHACCKAKAAEGEKPACCKKETDKACDNKADTKKVEKKK